MALVCSPIGFGKSHFIKNLPTRYKSMFLDGDQVLEEAGVPNQYSYWYDTDNNKKGTILRCLNDKILEGYIVLYSCNPHSLTYFLGTKIIVYDQNTNKRRERLEGFDSELFDKEEDIFLECINNSLMGKTVNVKYLTSFSQLLPKRVAVAGLARAGKDTIGSYLIQEHRFTRVAFSEPLYDILYAAQDICGFDKEKDRKFLQWVGTEWAREQDPDVWVRLAIKNIKNNYLFDPIVVTDLRYINELNTLRENGFMLVRVKRDTTNSDFGNGSKLHPSETEMLTVPDSDFDMVIDNNGTLEQLYEHIETDLIPILKNQ